MIGTWNVMLDDGYDETTVIDILMGSWESVNSQLPYFKEEYPDCSIYLEEVEED